MSNLLHKSVWIQHWIMTFSFLPFSICGACTSSMHITKGPLRDWNSSFHSRPLGWGPAIWVVETLQRLWCNFTIWNTFLQGKKEQRLFKWAHSPWLTVLVQHFIQMSHFILCKRKLKKYVQLNWGNNETVKLKPRRK